MTMKALLIGLAFLGLGAQSATAATLEKPVIVRFNPQTGAAEKLVLNKEIQSKEEAAALAKSGQFQAMANENVALSELDREAGASSWYWYCPHCYQPQYQQSYSYQAQYYYYGQSYYPYYQYSYNNCYYYYYSSNYSYRRNGWWR